MPVPQTKKLASMAGVASSQIATLSIPKFGTIYALRIHPKTSAGADVTIANMKSELSNIVLRIDGQEVVNATPTFLLDLERYYFDTRAQSGNANLNGEIVIPFARRTMANPLADAAFAIGTADVRDITLEVTCGTLVTVSTIECYLDVTPENRTLGQHIRITKFARSFSGTGIQEVSDLPKEPHTGVLAMHFTTGSDTGGIDDLTVITNGNNFYDAVPVSANSSKLQRAGRSPQANYYHVDFSLNNDLDGFIPMDGVTDWRVKPNWDAAVAPGNYNIYMERIYNLKPAS